MLVRQLDGYTIDASFSTTFIPLEISLFSLTVTSFYQKGGNQCKLNLRILPSIFDILNFLAIFIKCIVIK